MRLTPMLDSPRSHRLEARISLARLLSDPLVIGSHLREPIRIGKFLLFLRLELSKQRFRFRMQSDCGWCGVLNVRQVLGEGDVSKGVEARKYRADLLRTYVRIRMAWQKERFRARASAINDQQPEASERGIWNDSRQWIRHRTHGQSTDWRGGG